MHDAKKQCGDTGSEASTAACCCTARIDSATAPPSELRTFVTGMHTPQRASFRDTRSRGTPTGRLDAPALLLYTSRILFTSPGWKIVFTRFTNGDLPPSFQRHATLSADATLGLMTSTLAMMRVLGELPPGSVCSL